MIYVLARTYGHLSHFYHLNVAQNIAFPLSEHLAISSKSLVYASFTDHNIANLD